MAASYPDRMRDAIVLPGPYIGAWGAAGTPWSGGAGAAAKGGRPSASDQSAAAAIRDERQNPALAPATTST
eukprot:CAMPEP_0178454368 /NCGR_PEP_ID=MMETSP0689_2-20121128/45322_1 /TAXON_ID=160604 /ORGANISM="Amphidinium massartii, Strain CS-259" /LENGTH=70 /DNA_ID=CAMNT_0020080299 /DNA_START=1050 /DNA_END=1258 /DNA_ORIENTATION=-